MSDVVGGSRVAFTLKHLMLAVILLTVMFPVYWLMSMSVKSTRELSARRERLSEIGEKLQPGRSVARRK